MIFFLRRSPLSAKPFQLGLCFIALLTLLGCTATYTAGFVNSPDGKYAFYGHVRGAYGRSFNDPTAKTIFLSIVKNDNGKEKDLLERKLHVAGSAVGWEALWDKNDNLDLVIYDYGAGISSYDARRNGIPKRKIHAISYKMNPGTGTFTESAGGNQ